MKSLKRGKNISKVEILTLSRFGLWVLVNQREYFLDYKKFPWFKSAKVSNVLEVNLINHHHLYWPKLDIDLELESLESPEQYPMIYNL